MLRFQMLRMARFGTVLFLLAYSSIGYGKRYCREDSDCDVIGDLTCQKSQCNDWGICGCPRGKASKFVGSSLKFQCVPLKQIGEACSTDGVVGLCGPANSECVDGKCVCEENFVSIWDGERCSNNTGSSNSETCSASLGLCTFDLMGGYGPSVCVRSSMNWWFPQHDSSPFDGIPNTCACRSGQHTQIPNDYDASDFVGRREPRCVDIIVGDKCLRDDDCSNIDGDAFCNENFECACNASLIVFNGGKSCAAKADVLMKGDKCWENNTIVASGHCGMNMVCGDVCNLKDYLDTNKARTCVCAPGFRENGDDCVPVESGKSCNGDAMCKGLGYDALCIDGVCRASATTKVRSFTILLLAFAAHMFT